MPRPIKAIIHTQAMTHNYQVAKKNAVNAKAWAVVKAHAYGHGLHHALSAFKEADGLALVELDLAIRLRQLGWTKPILLLEGFFHGVDLPLVKHHQLEVVVHCFEQISLLEQAQLAQQNPIKIHIKINGGMNRLGFTPQQANEAIGRLSAMQGVQLVDFVMHFANADDPNNPRLPVSTQLANLAQFKAALQNDPNQSAISHLSSSLCNSAATLLRPDLANQWVRAGIMLYGSSPSPSTKSAAQFGLLPTMTLQSEVIATQKVLAGQFIGYGSRYIAPHDMRIAIVACGYADGYPRHAKDGTPVLIDGVRCDLVGRVSMDMLTVDISTLPKARVGSIATLWGQGLPIDDVALAADTIGYELMCALAQRVDVVTA